MRPVLPSSSSALAAAFALFEGFRHARGLAVAPEGSHRLTFVRPFDPAAAGLAWTSAGDDALELRWGQAGAEVGERLFVHAACEREVPQLALFLRRDRPAVQLRFSGASWLQMPDGRYGLRERLTIPSHGDRLEARQALAIRLAARWGVPLDGSWLLIGHWDPLEGSWEAGTVQRLAAVALIAAALREA